MRAALTVRDLLAAEPLRQATLAGGGAGLDASISEIGLVTTGRELQALGPGAGCVLDVAGGVPAPAAPSGAGGGAAGGPVYRQHLVEIICRRLHANGGRLLVVAATDARPAPASTGRLADRLGIPVVIAAAASAPALTAELLALVHAPGITLARAVTAAARRLPGTGGALDRVLPVLDQILSARCAAIIPDGTVIAGATPRIAHIRLPPHPATVAERAGDTGLALAPVLGADQSVAFWLAAESDRAGPVWSDTAGVVMGMAAGYVAGRNAVDQLAAERDARYLSGLLTELLEAEDPLPAHIGERAAKAGWRLDGWHCAIYLTELTAATDRPALLSASQRARLTDSLAGMCLASPLIERGDGWVTWVTTGREPAAARGRDQIAELRRALASYHAAPGVPAVVAGVGSPAQGISGLGASVAEARQAAMVASASHQPGTVRDADRLGVGRLLLGWYGSAAFRDHALHLLDPLLRADGGEQLLETLEAYLDTGGAPTETAARLGLHRNTVAQRIRRAETELSVSFSNPDERLAVHLACRALRLGRLPG